MISPNKIEYNMSTNLIIVKLSLSNESVTRAATPYIDKAIKSIFISQKRAKYIKISAR